MVKTINLGKKNVTIDERVKENMKSGKYMNNTQYLILEQEIRKKELEIQEFERKMKQETEKARTAKQLSQQSQEVLDEIMTVNNK